MEPHPWWHRFAWKEWDVGVEADVSVAAALASLNGGGDPPEPWLAFPAFHEVDGAATATAQPRGDPHAVARGIRTLLALSAARPTWRFRVAVGGEPLFAVVGGALLDGSEVSGDAVRRFLDAERAAASATVRFSRLEVHVTFPEGADDDTRDAARWRAALDALPDRRVTSDDGVPVPVATDLRVDVNASGVVLSGTLPTRAGGPAVRTFLKGVVTELFARWSLSELDLRIVGDGAEVARAANAVELDTLAAALARRWKR